MKTSSSKSGGGKIERATTILRRKGSAGGGSQVLMTHKENMGTNAICILLYIISFNIFFCSGETVFRQMIRQGQ